MIFMFWAQSLLAGNGPSMTSLRESRSPVTTLNVATNVKPLMIWFEISGNLLLLKFFGYVMKLETLAENALFLILLLQ